MSQFVIEMDIDHIPNSCDECPLRVPCNACEGYEDKCILSWRDCIYYGERLPKCNILCKLPEGHGRLVDADSLPDLMPRYYNGYMTVGIPTVVPAERSENV